MGRQRAEFLRSCRARLQPADLGLPEPQRRRTAGLRREDVAALSGVSVAWYTWLEQGREMRVSDHMLERISNTLRLSPDERTYLFSLIQSRPPQLPPESHTELAPELVRTVDGLSVPTAVLNLRWDVLHWNRLQSILYRDYNNLAENRRNLIELLFDRPTSTQDLASFEITARRVLAKLRVDFSRSGNDPQFHALIRRLETQSPLFRSMWRTPEINVGSYGLYRFRHPLFGDLAFEHTSYVPEDHPALRMVLCMPADKVTREAVEKAVASLRPAAAR
jgi:transcriptional regulator with XRE-family HTH domain